MSAKDAELLSDKNWAKWSSEVIDKGLEFGDAGRSIRTGVKPDFRNPSLSDEREITSGIVMTRAQAAAIVNELTREILLNDEDKDPGDAHAEAAATFEPVYESESELQEARRQLSKRRIKFEEDKQRFLGYILSRLTDSAKYKLKAHPDYASARDREDLLAIWKLLEETHGRRGLFSDVLISQRLHAARQGTRSFEAYVVYFQELVTNLTLHNAAPSNRDLTIMFLQSINAQPFGTAVRDILISNPLPSLAEAIGILTAQKLADQVMQETSAVLNSKPSEVKKKVDSAVFKTEKKTQSDDKKPKIVCYNCGEAGHKNRACTKDRVTCDKCGKDGHMSKYCDDVAKLLTQSKKSKTKEVLLGETSTVDEFIFSKCTTVIECDRDSLVIVAESGDDNDDTPIVKDSRSHEIIFDSASQETVVNNKELLLDITPVRKNVYLIGIGGHRVPVTHKGVLVNMGIPAVFAEGASSNVLSMPQMVDHGYKFDVSSTNMRVYYDGKLQSTVRQNNKGFWTTTLEVPSRYVNITLADRHFTPEQIERAKKARRLHVCLGHPSDEGLCKMLDNGTLLNCEVTSSDVRNAHSILGNCDACVAGKIVAAPTGASHSEPATAVGDHVYVDLIELQERSIGGYHWFLISVDEYSSILHIVGMKSKHSGSVESALLSIVKQYNAQGHKVRRITSDAERTFLSTISGLASLGIQLTSTIPGEHEKRVERYIRTIKDRKRTIMASLPYVLPVNLHGELLQYIVSVLNLTPNSTTGVQLPYEIFYGKKPDLNYMALLPFGQAALIKTVNSKNKEASRTEYGIALGWSLLTPGALRVYIPHRNLIAVRNIRNIRVTEVIPPEWKWISQIPARPFVDASAEPVDTLPVMDNPNVIVQDSAPEYVEEDLPLPLVSQDMPTQEGGVNDMNSESSIIPVVQESIVPVPEDDVTTATHEDTASSSQENVVSGHGPIHSSSDSDAPVSSSVDERLTIRIPRAIWNEVSQDTVDHNIVLHVSIEAALRSQYKDTVDSAVRKELQNMIDNQVWEVVDYNSIGSSESANIIPTHMFIKFKHKPDGSFDKTKARLVCQGNHEPEAAYNRTASKTVNIITVFILLKIMTFKKLKAKTYDIPGAYLKTARNHPVELYAVLSPAVARNWCNIVQEDRKFLHSGKLYAKLKKCVYGLKEAAYEFYMLLSTFLISIGFIKSEADDCLFYLYEDDKNFLYVVTHVDDLFAIGLGRVFHYLEACMEERFGSIEVQFGSKLFYLGMTIERNESVGTTSISQHGCIQDLLLKYKCDDVKVVDNPCAYNFLEEDVSSPACSKFEYLSLCMSLMYLARMTRPDILFAVSFLATKSAQPTVGDYDKLKRILSYLKGTASLRMVMSGDDFSLKIFADASYGIHHDGRSHSGIVINIGKDPIFVRSVKQQCVSLSSTEAEIIALVDALSYLEWIERIFKELRIVHTGPVEVFQDNQSAIHMITKEFKFKKTKHMTVRVYYARKLVDDKRIVLQYLPSEEMPADLLTKSLGTKNFLKLVVKFVV